MEFSASARKICGEPVSYTHLDVYKRQEYAELFTEQMLRSRAAIPLRRWLTRYQALTGVEYIEYFNKRHWLTLRSFVLLVERKEINLWQFFEQHKGCLLYTSREHKCRRYMTYGFLLKDEPHRYVYCSNLRCRESDTPKERLRILRLYREHLAQTGGRCV